MTHQRATALFIAAPAWAQNPNPPKKKEPPFKWVNPLKQKYEGVSHATFKSPSMGVDVGYCIYLPPQYAKQSNRRFPVVYYLHGGRPGSELKSVKLAPYIHENISAGKVAPMIYVFVNGGAMSHYNYPQLNSYGEDVFVKELIPHIDKTYRTIANRRGRGLEGFSQGGRGTARIMFKHPNKFVSGAPGGGGHEAEKRISDTGGIESANVVFAKGYNTYDLARGYAALAKKPQPELNILVYVGREGFNYPNNLAYMKFLRSLDIPFDYELVPGVGHSATGIYDKQALRIMKFHAEKFKAAKKK
jgi:endo-1,4-beta-xylanase